MQFSELPNGIREHQLLFFKSISGTCILCLPGFNKHDIEVHDNKKTYEN